MDEYQFGLNTFGDVTVDADGKIKPMSQVLKDTVEQGVLADKVGIDFIGIGEHHRDDYSVSAPDIVLTAIAAQTENIYVGTAVTVLSSDDPIRVFQRFATLNAISDGRAEVIVGRGSFIESFPLFGYELKDYDMLFSEKADLFMKLINSEGKPVSWEGTYRTPLKHVIVYPAVEKFTAWIGVGGTPASIIRAAEYNAPLAVAIIGGVPEKFIPHVKLYRDKLEQFGFTPQPVAVHSPGHVAKTDELAQEQAYKSYKETYEKLGRERGWTNTVTPMQYMADVNGGSLYVGSPETVAKRIAKTVQTLGVQRFDLKYATGTMPHEQLMESIELYGTEVIPMVKDILNR